MPVPAKSVFEARFVDGAHLVDAAAWDALAGHANPFVSHAFISALEESGAASATTGWRPFHLALHEDGGRLAGLMPAYLKGHSYGEYVFDHGWANAYERAGGRYYPKLQSCVPFSPVTGPRLLAGGKAVAMALVEAAKMLVEQHGLSGFHVTFADEAEVPLYEAQDMLIRTDQQFHWRNQGYRDFEDFLDALASRKRKAVRKERREALAAGIEIRHLSGSDLTEAAWDAFFAFYMDTANRKWGGPISTGVSFRYWVKNWARALC